MNDLVPYGASAPAPATGARIPPSHVESERSALGCALRTGKAALVVLEALTPEDFYDPANREVFLAMQRIAELSAPIDLVTLDAELSRVGKLDAIGGAAYLVELTRSVPSSVNVRAYLEIIKQKSTMRKLIAASERILKYAYEEQEDSTSIIASAEREIAELTVQSSGDGLQHIEPILLDTFEHIEELVKNNGQVNGVPSGYTELDDLLTGFHPGEMILIAGRPSMGKTSLGMNIVANAAIRAGKRVAVFSLEMPARQIALRLLCTEGRVNLQNVRRGQLSDDEWGRIADAISTVGRSEIYVDATPGSTVSSIRSKAKRLQLEHGLDMVLIDYLSLMQAEGRFGSRQEEVSAISRSLKRLAIELDVPIVALQQLSRAPTGRANHRPILSDIRESGAIEQDADVVMFIHRESYYDPDAEKNVAELIVAKQRNGALGTVKLGWHGEFTWFIDRSPYPKEAEKQEGTKDENH